MGITLFTCGRVQIIGRYIFDEFVAVYICVAKDNENVNFGMKTVLRSTHFTFIYLPVRYN